MSDYSLVDQTNSWITRPRFKASRMLSLYPSEASVTFTEDGRTVTEGTCRRAAYFRATGEEKAAPPDDRGERIMSVGKTIEQWFIDRWKEMGIWVDNNVKFYWKDYNISGELDCVLVEPDTGDVYGVEIKTFYGYEAAKGIFGNKKLAGNPKINQLLQTLIYTFYFKDKLKYFKMVYMDRGDCKVREFKIEVKQAADGKWYPVVNGYMWKKFSMEDILERYKMLNYHVQNGLTPARDYELEWSDEKVEAENKAGNVSKTAYAEWSKGKRKIGDWQCRYCAYKNPCWGLDETESADEESADEVQA